MDGLPDERPKQLTPPSFGRDVKLGVPCLDAACIGLNQLNKLGITAFSKSSKNNNNKKVAQPIQGGDRITPKAPKVLRL